MEVIGLILAGGSGTRLWPLSRKLLPKQLLSLTGDKSLLQETSNRIEPVISKGRQWIITNKELFHQVDKQMKTCIVPDEEDICDDGSVRVMVEPDSKNTAPAVLWAAIKCRKGYGSDAVMVVLPSDHLIIKESAFLNILRKGIAKASGGFLLTFGIKPHYPETGYGYIKAMTADTGTDEILKVDRFVEKPNQETAEGFIADGSYLWNSGMFVFHVGTLLEEASIHCPELYTMLNDVDPDDSEQIRKAFRRIEPISIDKAIMEKTDKAMVLKADIGWSDIGSWQSLYEISPKDENQNTVIGNHIAIDTNRSYIYSMERLVVTLGVENLAVIDTNDALLVASLDQTHRMKEVMDKLKELNSKTHIEHNTVQRPWGQYKVLQEGIDYKIKRIMVNPSEKLSRQYHHHRSEHWTVVRGMAKVTCGETECFVHENESTFIAPGEIHRLENPGKIPLEIIEIQCGSYLEEDDIVRLEDVYER